MPRQTIRQVGSLSPDKPARIKDVGRFSSYVLFAQRLVFLLRWVAVYFFAFLGLLGKLYVVLRRFFARCFVYALRTVAAVGCILRLLFVFFLHSLFFKVNKFLYCRRQYRAMKKRRLPPLTPFSVVPIQYCGLIRSEFFPQFFQKGYLRRIDLFSGGV